MKISRACVVFAVAGSMFLTATACSKDEKKDAAPASSATTSSSAAPSSPTTGTATKSSAPTSPCATTSEALVTIESRGGEPEVKVPLPTGWQKVDVDSSGDVRARFANTAYATQNYQPDMLILFNDFGGQKVTAQQAFEAEERSVTESGGTIVKNEDHTVCELPAKLFAFQYPADGDKPARRIAAIVVAAPAGDKIIGVDLIITSVDQDNKAFGDDAEKIVEGFQVTPRA